ISVEAFNRIDRDMGARVAKVRDINSDLCALIKIETIETGFEFSGCIIEKTEQKTGEIWVFVSPGVKFLTIKHKDFGVLRNYNFPQSIESGVVYQMKLSTEAKEVKIDTSTINKAVDSKIDAKMEEMNKKLAELEQLKQDLLKQSQKEKEPEVKKEKPVRIRPVYDKETFAMLNAAYSVAPQTSFGITFGVQKTWGWYVSVSSGLQFDALNTKYEDDAGTAEYYYDGKTSSSRLSAHTGVMYRIAKPISLKLGLGYGVRNQAFSTINGDYVKIKANSYSGLEYSAGVHLSFGRMAFSVDVLGLGTDFKYSEIKVGIGYNLKIKKHANKEQKGE
ncbi:MAG: hypothetical protein IKJ67_05935, partial [Bacteroidales bacterium]|nr:hypothetical protein [Bacteroidales bacterium]